MHIEMTGQTVREHLQLFFVMRFIMTVEAARDHGVLQVTRGAGNLTVFTRSPLPLAIDSVMTFVASLNLGIARETDLQWCVSSVMAGHTILNSLLGIVAIMAFQAVRYIAVLVLMTTLTTLLGVGTRKFLHLF